MLKWIHTLFTLGVALLRSLISDFCLQILDIRWFGLELEVWSLVFS